MTKEELNTIQKRADAATPGPWTSVASDGSRLVKLVKLAYPRHHPKNANEVLACTNVDKPGLLANVSHDYRNGINDAEFMAHARQDIPRLLSEVRELRTRLEELTIVT